MPQVPCIRLSIMTAQFVKNPSKFLVHDCPEHNVYSRNGWRLIDKFVLLVQNLWLDPARRGTHGYQPWLTQKYLCFQGYIPFFASRIWCTERRDPVSHAGQASNRDVSPPTAITSLLQIFCRLYAGTGLRANELFLVLPTKLSLSGVKQHNIPALNGHTLLLSCTFNIGNSNHLAL